MEQTLALPKVKNQLEEYFDRLWPINRSLMGTGYRESLSILSEIVPHDVLEFPTGQKVFDWTVPNEWDIQEAYIVCPDGKKICDFKENNLHIVGYSAPFRGTLSLAELKEHLYSLPDQPDAVPYITSYYKERWGFCISHNQLTRLEDGNYEAVVDSKLFPGHLDVAEAVLKGESEDEILFASYLCHPSLANNELSGPLVLAFLYQELKKRKNRRYTYRFVLHPETIGSICYLTLKGEHLKKHLKAGYVLSCLGDAGSFTYKLSKRENSLADMAAQLVLRDYPSSRIIPYDPTLSSDERQYCSPGFNFPVGSLMRTPYAQYSQYHTSLDNKDIMDFDAFSESVHAYARIVETLEANKIWKNKVPHCDPQLGPRGLYPSLSTKDELDSYMKATFWLLSYADGTNDLMTIAEKSKMNIEDLSKVAQKFAEADLLEDVTNKL